MLNRFETVECVFGYEGVLDHFSTILARQKVFSENLLTAIKSLEDTRKQFIVEKILQRQIVFYVVKDAIAHSKIYLLENGTQRRVIVGSVNLSDRAFSGKQAETIVVFDNDERAWTHYQREYEAVRQSATNQFTPRDLTQTEVAFQDIPLLQDALKFSSDILTGIFADACPDPLPAWCSPLSIESYTGKRYEKIRIELLKLYETQPAIWEIRPREAILRVQPFEALSLRKDIPDWILKEGSRGGNIILDRAALEEFLEISFKKRRLLRWRG